MTGLTRTAAVAATAVALSLAIGGPAEAHGVCKTTASPPVPALLAVSYAGAFDCSDNHPDIYIHVCLEKSVSGLTGWEQVDCAFGHASGGNHVHAVDTATDVCLVGFYRTVAYGHNANLTHQAWDVSAPVACAAR